MNNLITLFLGMLSHFGVITESEAEKLDKELQVATLPDNFEASMHMLKTVFEKTGIEKKTIAKK